VFDVGDHVRWQENMLDLVPNQDDVIEAEGLGNPGVQVTYLGRRNLV
jgi:hypothetical protein